MFPVFKKDKCQKKLVNFRDQYILKSAFRKGIITVNTFTQVIFILKMSFYVIFILKTKEKNYNRQNDCFISK